MDEEMLKAAGIDYDMALERFVGNRAIYESFLKKYISDTHVQDASAAYKAVDYRGMLEQVHALKGIAGTLGLNELYRISADIVNNLRTESYDCLEEKLKALRCEHERMTQLLQKCQG